MTELKLRFCRDHPTGASFAETAGHSFNPTPPQLENAAKMIQKSFHFSTNLLPHHLDRWIAIAVGPFILFHSSIFFCLKYILAQF